MATARLLLVVFVLLALVHVYWACGGRWGRNVAVPERPTLAGSSSVASGAALFVPSRIATLGVAAVLAAVGAVLSLYAGIFAPPVHRPVPKAALAVTALAFLARAVGDFRWVGFFKRANPSAFARWDTAVYSPLCMLIGAGLLHVTYT